MNNPKSALAIMFLAAAAALAAPVDEFLADVEATILGEGVPKAIAILDAKLASGDFTGDDAARCRLRKVRLLSEREREIGGQILLDDIIRAKDVLPETKLKAGELMIRIMVPIHGYGPVIRQYRGMCDTFLALPEFQSPGPIRGKMLCIVGTVQNLRNFCDLSYETYLEAADNFASEPDKQAEALFKAAEQAVLLRDREGASKTLARAAAIKGISLETAKMAKLRQGMAVLARDQYDWHPTPERVAEGRALIEEALALHGTRQLIPPGEAFKARFRLMDAEYRSGDYKSAIELGRSVVDGGRPKGVDGNEMDKFTVALASILEEAGEWKLAIDYYEKGISYATTRDIKLRIGNVARKHHDYQRAMQAYSAALAACDRNEDTDRWNRIKGLVSVMSNAVRNKTSLSEAEDVFGKTDDELGRLELDEQ